MAQSIPSTVYWHIRYVHLIYEYLGELNKIPSIDWVNENDPYMGSIHKFVYDFSVIKHIDAFSFTSLAEFLCSSDGCKKSKDSANIAVISSDSEFFNTPVNHLTFNNFQVKLFNRFDDARAWLGI